MTTVPWHTLVAFAVLAAAIVYHGYLHVRYVK